MEGYTKVAELMATHPEFAILRRFKALNMQTLLYLQAEITHLEADLHEIAMRDIRHSNRENYAYDWWSLSGGVGGQEDDTEQWDKILAIREKLEKYSMQTLSGYRLHQSLMLSS